ncbi:MAG: type II toxin-antitoxin system RelE/ParE family toxin [Gemmatimonadota bacterium]
MNAAPKSLYWVGSSKDDLKRFPESVRRVMGYALYLAQLGEKHPDAKPLKGFGGAGVLEIVEDREGDTYRGIYTVRLKGAVYVLHAFKKKAKRARETPKRELDLIRERLKAAHRHHERRD